jgi:CDP-6-deoxy-D-xylo-4-hexulose-3-dehydrase
VKQAHRESAEPTRLRREILGLVGRYFEAAHSPRAFEPGRESVPVAGRVLDAADMQSLVEAALDCWLTEGRFAAQFAGELARYCGVAHAVLVNSGSSANLLALTCLTAPELGARRLRPGDEVITAATGFPTTVNPVIQNGLAPVFVDVVLPTYNLDLGQLEAACSPRTRAIILAHTLGNPFDANRVADFARRRDLWLIEDCCDALGASFQGRKVGSFGHLATLSFYPAHHITTGEGGAVLTGDPLLRRLLESYRDWGRDCWCRTGRDNACGRRFEQQHGELPHGYDHKHTFSHLGYNLKMTDLQAALGVSQMRKLPGFVEARARNFGLLRDGLRDLEDHFLLPEATPGSEPSWFGLPLAVRPGGRWERLDWIRRLEANGIATRLLFGGNLARQPAYRESSFRCIGSLGTADFVMRQAFWIGVYPGVSPRMIEHTLGVFHAAAEREQPCLVGGGKP